MKKFPVMALSDLTRDATNYSDLLNRFNSYASHFSKFLDDDEVKLHLITKELPSHFDLKSSNWPFLVIIQTKKSSFSYVSSLIKFVIRNRSSISLVIAGNPWKDFLFSLSIKLISKIPIQVSIHGEPYKAGSGSLLTPGKLKHFWLKVFLRYADSIRIVSDHQIASLKSLYKVRESRIILSPIPVEIPSNNLIPKLKTTIAFVGRLHEERDPLLWLRIIRELFNLRQDFSVIIIGDGPLRDEVRQYLRTHMPALEYTMVGRISHPEVQRYWNEISVLLSTAQNESFGLTLREAQLAGVSVVARRNSGTLANELEFGNSIRLFDTTREAVAAIDKAANTPNSEDNLLRIRLIQSQINQTSLNNLAESWKA
jgi:glycosyltransferase involved in cell wall biosynthesis